MSQRQREGKERDPDMVNAETALRRAAQRARERARQAGGYVAVYRNGEIVLERLAEREVPE